MNTDHVTAEDIAATVKGLRKRLRAVPAAKRCAHWQIADRRVKDAALFAVRVPDHAVKCCWEARFHLNEAGAP